MFSYDDLEVFWCCAHVAWRIVWFSTKCASKAEIFVFFVRMSSLHVSDFEVAFIENEF